MFKLNKDITNGTLILLLWFSAWNFLQHAYTYIFKFYKISKPTTLMFIYGTFTIILLFILYKYNKNMDFILTYGI